VVGVIVRPLMLWLWSGAALMGLGTLLAAWPGRRRRPTEPVSAPVPMERVDEPAPVP
jgi:cytochrome c-type biogenesis protein CcmF